jgi:hypothetical protein
LHVTAGPSSLAIIPLAADVFVPRPDAIAFPSFSLSEFESQHMDTPV